MKSLTKKKKGGKTSTLFSTSPTVCVCLFRLLFMGLHQLLVTRCLKFRSCHTLDAWHCCQPLKIDRASLSPRVINPSSYDSMYFPAFSSWHLCAEPEVMVIYLIKQCQKLIYFRQVDRFVDVVSVAGHDKHGRTYSVSLKWQVLNYKRHKAIILLRQFPSCRFAVLACVRLASQLFISNALAIGRYRSAITLLDFFQERLSFPSPLLSQVGDRSLGGEWEEAVLYIYIYVCMCVWSGIVRMFLAWWVVRCLIWMLLVGLIVRLPTVCCRESSC